MRIFLIIFCLFAQIMAHRFLFAADVDCESDNVFEYTVSYWEGDKQLSKNRTVTAVKNIFFYQEGATYKIEHPNNVYAKIEHNCTESGEPEFLELWLDGVQADKVVHRIDYYINLSRTDELPDHSSSTSN